MVGYGAGWGSWSSRGFGSDGVNLACATEKYQPCDPVRVARHSMKIKHSVMVHPDKPSTVCYGRNGTWLGLGRHPSEIAGNRLRLMHSAARSGLARFLLLPWNPGNVCACSPPAFKVPVLPMMLLTNKLVASSILFYQRNEGSYAEEARWL